MERKKPTIGYLPASPDNTFASVRKKCFQRDRSNAPFQPVSLRIPSDAKGVIEIFGIGAEGMAGYAAVEVMNPITTADQFRSEESRRIGPKYDLVWSSA